MEQAWSWFDPRLELRQSPIHGNGVFAGKRISQGERVAIFGGAVMRIDEIDSLPEPLQDYPMQIEERFVLGIRHNGGPELGDFFNHSCNPNCGFKGQIFLVAMRNIKADEELTFDYAMVVSVSVESNIVFEMDCSCGASECRRRITETDWTLPELRRRYDGYFSQYLAEKIALDIIDSKTK